MAANNSGDYLTSNVNANGVPVARGSSSGPGSDKKRRRMRSNSSSVMNAMTSQFDELISSFEHLIDGQIPLKQQASSLKTKVESERQKLVDLIKRNQKALRSKFERKTLLFRVQMQKQLRSAITGDPNRSLRRHIQEPPQVKLIDKLSFTISVLTLILSELFLLSFPALFKLFYAAMLIPLMIARYVDYRDKKYHFFLFDFCYFVNFIALIHIFLFPHSIWLTETLFVLANGPVLVAIFLWRNSMVLHSLEKMTSLFIHAFPPFYTFCARWLDVKHSEIREDHSAELGTMAWLIYPSVMYVVWQSAYLIKTEVVSKNYLDENEDIETSLRWIAKNRKNVSHRLGKRFCVYLGVMSESEEFDARTVKTKCIFVSLNFLYFVVAIVPTRLLFKYQFAHLGAILLALLSSVWQGANYYIEVFSERYHGELERKAKQIEERYLFVDENLDHLLNQNWRDISTLSDTDVSDLEYDTDDAVEYRTHATHAPSSPSSTGMGMGRMAD